MPILKFPITQKIMERFNITDEMMQNVAVAFSMFDDEEEQYVIANKKGEISYREDIQETPYETKYTLYYVFDEIDTFNHGRYSGEFKLNFVGDYCGTITLPNNDYINILISKTHTKTDIVNIINTLKNVEYLDIDSMGNDILLTWIYYTDEYSFSIERSIDNSNWSEINIVSDGYLNNNVYQYFYSDENLSYGITYYYRIKVLSNNINYSDSQYSSVVFKTIIMSQQ
jgi:hypothetical protein